MIYESEALEREALLATARAMCAAARTAPKAKGLDLIRTLVLTDGEKDAVADKLEELSEPLGYAFFKRDARNVRAAGALVVLGVKEGKRGLGAGCGYCHFKDCEDCAAHDGMCAWDGIDLGIAVGSAVSVAADARVDSRVFFSAGRAVLAMGLLGEGVGQVVAIPISVSGKSPFFDRKA